MTVESGVEITGAITKHMDRRFLSSIDLMGQGVVKLTIKKIEKHAVLKYLNGNTEKDAILIHFVETDKPLKLCVTNIKAIIMILNSTKVEDWKGKKIKLEVKMVKAFGEMKPAVRVIE